MPGNLLAPRTRTAPPRAAGGWVVFHPARGEALRSCGLLTADQLLGLPGEVVSGHADRHVVRVELPGSEVVYYLKRQHHVGWRERLRQAVAGFGWVSRSEREARLLEQLESAGFACPKWVACGEDGRGRAFLLVEELAGFVELRRLLSDTVVSLDLRGLAERIGRTIAALHAAGFTTPELTAKHVFVHPDTLAVALIDWQSARRVGRPRRPKPRVPRAARPPVWVSGSSTGGSSARGTPEGGIYSFGRCVPIGAGVRSLAALHASLAGPLAGPRDRLRFLWAYLRTARRHGSAGPRLAELARHVLRESSRLAGRRSVRDQRQPVVTTGGQRLVWLAGEAVCAVPDVAAVWPTPAVTAPFYPPGPEPGRPLVVRLADGRRGLLTRFRTVAPVGRLMAWLRGRPWRSPGATLGRVLFHLERYGIPAPRLLAFGQRETGPTAADSFVLHEPPAGEPLDRWLTGPHDPEDCRPVFEQAGRLLRQLHDAGCRLRFADGELPLRVDAAGRVLLGDVRAVRLVRRLSVRARRADLRALTRRLRLAHRGEG